jgi:hypothetical protein
MVRCSRATIWRVIDITALGCRSSSSPRASRVNIASSLSRMARTVWRSGGLGEDRHLADHFLRDLADDLEPSGYST